MEKLGGEGKIVEIDESKFGKRKYNSGKAVDGKWVFGGIEQGTDKLFMETVADHTKETLWALIHKYIAPGTIIWSDKWRSYHSLDTVGYRHETVNHSNEFKSASGVCTNSIEGSWNAVKRSFPKMGTSKKLYEGYLAEYLIRRRHMKAFNFRFETFLDKIANVYGPKSLRSTDYDEPSNEDNISEPDSDDENEDGEEEDTFRYDVMMTDKYQYVGCDGCVCFGYTGSIQYKRFLI